MLIKTISTEYQRKFNTGEYESAALSAGAWADIDQGEDPKTCMTALLDFCKEQVREQAQPILRGRKGHGVEYSMLADDHAELQEAVIEFINAIPANFDKENQTLLYEMMAESKELLALMPPELREKYDVAPLEPEGENQEPG